MPCSVAGRRQRRRWRRWRRRLVAPSFGLATGYANTLSRTPPPPPRATRPPISLSLPLSRSPVAPGPVFLSPLSIRRCPVPPAILRPSLSDARPPSVARSYPRRVRLHAPYARLRVRSRRFHAHARPPLLCTAPERAVRESRTRLLVRIAMYARIIYLRRRAV